MRTITCIGWGDHVCGAIVEATSGHKKRCSDCALEHNRKGHLKWHNEHREYSTVVHHWHFIFNSKSHAYRRYKDMPFYDGWNPDAGGSFKAGEVWIIANLGKRPEGASLHIVDHALGFVPGNLEWATQKRQIAEQMFKIIANQRHEIKQLKEQLQELKLAA